MTRSGVTCQRWDSQSPHDHSYTPAYFPVQSISDTANYCRNKDLAYVITEPWCFTMGSERWEYCDIPTCKGRVPVGLKGIMGSEDTVMLAFIIILV